MINWLFRFQQVIDFPVAGNFVTFLFPWVVVYCPYRKIKRRNSYVVFGISPLHDLQKGEEMAG